MNLSSRVSSFPSSRYGFTGGLGVLRPETLSEYMSGDPVTSVPDMVPRDAWLIETYAALRKDTMAGTTRS